MKIYTNGSNRVVCLKADDITYFLKIGESIELDVDIKDLPEGVMVKTIRKRRKGDKE